MKQTKKREKGGISEVAYLDHQSYSHQSHTNCSIGNYLDPSSRFGYSLS